MTPNYSISEAFASYLKTNSPKKTASSQKIDRRVLAITEWFLEKELGLFHMSSVTVEALEQLEIWSSEPHECGTISKQAWGPNSIMRHSKTIKTIFRKAFLTGRIQRDPTALWKLSPADPPPRALMTDEQFDAILSIAPPWFQPVLRILEATGQRPSGVARLKWSDVEFDNGVAFFTSRKGGRNREKRNAFPLNEVRSIFESIPKLGEFVFLKNGLPISGSLISMTAHRIIKAAGFKVQIYSLRHKFITKLIQSGTPNEITRRLVGHANESQIKTYAKNLDIAALGLAVEKMRGKK